MKEKSRVTRQSSAQQAVTPMSTAETKSTPLQSSKVTFYGRVQISSAAPSALPEKVVDLTSVDVAPAGQLAQPANLSVHAPHFFQRMVLDRFANEIAPGDHIRKSMYMEVMQGVEPFEYYHDGLFIGGKLVIHYSGNAGPGSTGKVEIVTLKEFGDQCEIEVVPHPNRRFSNTESIRRAVSRYRENSYSLISNNCQHFVNWCIEGEHRSEQVDVALSVAPFAHRALLKAILSMFV